MSVAIYQHEAPSNEKMTFTVFLATAFHLILILGLSFTLPEEAKDNTAPTLEVTLSTSFSEVEPEDADFIGQANQEGGGNIDDKAVPTTTEKPKFSEPTPKELSTPQSKVAAEQQQQIETQRITTTDSEASPLLDFDPQPLEKEEETELTQAEFYERAFEIASLEAEIADKQEAYAKRPRKTFIRANVKQHSHAFYLKEWTDRIEEVGNRQYPDSARRQKLHGDVTVVVTIAQDGSLVNASVALSSGHKILDDAALRIVRLAAPFSPLPPEIRKTTDQLVITRVWEFKPGNRISTRNQ